MISDKETTILITTENICKMLGGISRGTFYKWRKAWERGGTPFPAPAVLPFSGCNHLYRYQDVMRFFHDRGLVSTSDKT
ncbi:TPA: helix-turn-helix domain-containing protein [Escherichia coli]